MWTLKFQPVPVLPSEHGCHRAALPPASQPFLQCSVLHLPLCSCTHEFPASLKALLTTASTSLFTIQEPLCHDSLLFYLFKLSSPVTPQIQSCFPGTFLPHLTAPQLLLLLSAYFKSQQKSWFRTPGLINIDTTNIPSLGTDWHGWSPPEVRDKMILWRCLPLKQFLVNWKGSFSILLSKKL